MISPERALGMLTDSPEIASWFASLGLVPHLIEDSTKVQSIEHGLEISLHVPWTIKLPAFAALDPKPKKKATPKSPYPRAAIFTITLYREGTQVWVAGTTRQEPMRPWAGELPHGIAWGVSTAALVEQFGEARYKTVDKTTGALTWVRWDDPEKQRFWMANAAADGIVSSVTCGLLVPKG